MAKNLIQLGNTMDYTATADVASSEAVAVGSMVGVAAEDIAEGETGVLLMEGVFNLPKKSADVIGQGVQVYLNNGVITITPGPVSAGRAWIAAGNGEDEIWVSLNNNQATAPAE